MSRKKKPRLKNILTNFTIKQYFFTLRDVNQAVHTACYSKTSILKFKPMRAWLCFLHKKFFLWSEKVKQEHHYILIIKPRTWVSKERRKKNLPVCKYITFQYYFQEMHACGSGIAWENGKLSTANHELRQMKTLKMSLFLHIAVY